MAHGERRLIAELSDLERAAQIDLQRPPNAGSEFTAALFVLLQSEVDAEGADWPELSEWFDSESAVFLTAASDMVDSFGGKSSATEPHRLVDGVENFRCFWFTDSTAAAIGAAQAVRTLIEERPIGQKAKIRLGIGRHGYAASNVALNSDAEAIGFDGVLWEKVSAGEQVALRRMVVTDPKINRRGFRRAFERYVSQNAPELVCNDSD